MINIPTLAELSASIKSAIETQFGITIHSSGKSFLRSLTAVMAGKLKEYYLVIGNLQKNIFVDTADSESLGGTLERFGRVKIGRNPFPPTAGQYELTITGSVGAIVKASTTFKSDDTSLNPGFLFILDNAYTLVATTDIITVRALTSGIESKLNILDTLTVTSPITLVDSGAYVSNEVVDPLAAETIEAYRTAVLNSYRLEPQGGAATDYRLWAQDAQGVRFVYPYAKSSAANEINLFIEATVADSTDGKGTPSAQLLSDVEDVIEFNPDATLPLLERGRRPLGVFEVHYLPVTIRDVKVIITGLLGRTAIIESLIETAIIDAVNLIRPFVSAADILTNKNDIIDTNKIIGVIITALPGAIFTSVTIEIDDVSTSTYTFSNGDISYIDANNITYN